jgi:hypothetical protein
VPTTQVSVAVDQSVLTVGDHHSVAYAVTAGERTGTRPPTGGDEDCAIHLATSADWQQPVRVEVEVIPAGEPLPAPDDTWQLEGEGVVRFRAMPLQAMTGLEDPVGVDLDLDPAPGIYRYRAWVRGREENRTLLENWLDAKTSDDLTAPTSLEEWLIQFTLTDQHDPRPAPQVLLTKEETVLRLKAKRAADRRG